MSGRKLGLEFVGAPQGASARLWVDVQTKRPARLEVETVQGNQFFAGGRVRAIYDQFEWDVALDAKLFTPEIPEGLRLIDLTIPPLTEETLIAGLRRFSELTGRYPAKLDPAGATAQMAVAWAMRNKPEIFTKGETPQIPAELMQDGMLVGVALGYVQKLARDGANPEYFGDTVTPEDTDDVLLRWTLPAGQERTVYGDLRVTPGPPNP